MTKKTKAGCVLAVLSICITTPIYYYLAYQIMMRVNASQLMWFLFWVYVPFSFLIQIAFKFTELEVFKDEEQPKAKPSAGTQSSR